jgi:outer membrane protein OmpA-like peptidoglycan-associated protein
MGLLWVLNHGRRLENIAVRPPNIGTANRAVIPSSKTVCSLPAGVTLPAAGAISRFWAFIQDPNTKVDETTWFNIDQISFETGSARLKPESKAQLDNVATILKNCPTVNLTVAGYTDNVGRAASNLRLSRNRANSVMAQLTNDGVPGTRLTAEGYGEENPIADNSTAEGRAENRRIAMRVTGK